MFLVCLPGLALGSALIGAGGWDTTRRASPCALASMASASLRCVDSIAPGRLAFYSSVFGISDFDFSVWILIGVGSPTFVMKCRHLVAKFCMPGACLQGLFSPRCGDIQLVLE